MNNNLPEKGSKILIYQTEDGRTRLEVRLEGETVWLNQAQLCELFDKNKRTISEHIRNIFKEGELQEEAVVRKYRTTAADGKSYNVAYYNLDVIISIGYRVKSHRGTQFRIWATQRLREYIVKGFILDDERLKQASSENYFDELLCSPAFVTSDPRKRSSGARFSTFMPPASTTTRLPTCRTNFLPWCRARCTGRPMGTRQRKLWPTGWMRISLIWA